MRTGTTAEHLFIFRLLNGKTGGLARWRRNENPGSHEPEVVNILQANVTIIRWGRTDALSRNT